MSIGTTLQDALDPVTPPAPTDTINRIALDNPNFDILWLATLATGYATTLNRPGDFTVFAPTDDAFRSLAEDTLGLDIDGLSDRQIALTLVNTLGAGVVGDVLAYHVQAGSASLAEIKGAGSVTTILGGASFDIAGNALVDADPGVENPEFIRGLTDIAATNGTIQVIDRVLLPIDVTEASAAPTIADIATTDFRFEILTALLVATGLDAAVADRDADLTVFAPADIAFRDLAGALGLDLSGKSHAEIADTFIGALGIDVVTDVLLYHVAGESFSRAELAGERIVETALADQRLLIEDGMVLDAEPDLTDARMLDFLSDIETANGVIHALDTVLLPFDLAPVAQQVAAGGGDDAIVGSGADDKIDGGGGDDVIQGGAGNDNLIGHAGDDILMADAGDDRLFGGAGADMFDFTRLDGLNVARDYDAAEGDVIAFSSADFATAQEVIDASYANALGVFVQGADGLAVIRDMAALTLDDFILV